tara:strand:- start:3247 stop:3369 length:123 start_codon:yes stop_codon:yes gene_type:complete
MARKKVKAKVDIKKYILGIGGVGGFIFVLALLLNSLQGTI